MITAVLTIREQEVRNGLEFILGHLDGLWPKYVAVRGRWKILVNNFEEAIDVFRAANFMDCRISAYPIYNDEYVKRTGGHQKLQKNSVDKRKLIH